MTSKTPLPGLLEGVADLIRSDKKMATFTQSYRQTGSKTFKRECPLFAVACLFEGGKGKEQISRLTGLSLVDFDHIVPATASTPAEMAKALAEMKQKIIADPHTLMCYTTISGNGFRVIFKYELPETDGFLVNADNLDKIISYYQSAFYCGNTHYEKLLNTKTDIQCKNITRLSGLAHDPDVFLRPESEAVAFTTEEIAAAVTAYAKQSKEDKQTGRIQTYFDTLVAPQLAKEGIVFQNGSHNEYVMRVGYLLAKRSFSKKEAIKWAMQRFGADYPDTRQVITSCYNSAGTRKSDSSEKRRDNSNFATVEEIQSFLESHIKLRYNEITSRVECCVPTDSEKGTDKEEWQPINDRKVNSLWVAMSKQKRVNKQDMYSIIESEYVPSYNPFVSYLESLPQWHEGDHDYIADLAATVKIKGEQEHIESPQASTQEEAQEEALKGMPQEEEGPSQDEASPKETSQEADSSLFTLRSSLPSLFTFRFSLKKWLVAMVAAWISPDVVNNVILVLIGEQGAYKTTWFNYLLPTQLKHYFYTKTNANRMSKDDLLTLTQYALVCCEELDTMRPAELNQLKATVTMTSIDERAAYAHYHEHRKHIASFCGTGNNTQFLSDPTGNRRWLPFEVESIVSPRDHPFPYEGIYSQALALYKSGFQYWFTKEEIIQLNSHNRKFEAPHLEQELVDLFFRKPLDHEHGEFMSVARALQIISSGISQKLSAVNVGRAFVDLGFKRVRTCTCRGFIVVSRTGDEIKEYQKTLLLNL